MSLVQEALKRKAEEQQTRMPTEDNAAEIPSTPPPAEPPATPPAPPAPPANLPPIFQPDGEPPEPPKSGALKAVLVWLLILLLLAGLGVGGYYAFQTGLFTNEKTDETAPEPAQKQPEPTREPSLAYQLIQKTKDIKAAETKDREEAAGLMTQAPSEPQEPAPAPTPTATPRKPEPTPTPRPAPTPKPTPVKAPPPTPPAAKTVSTAPAAPAHEFDAETAQDAPIVWPKIRLTGVMASKNKSAEGLAIIDGQIISCGQRIQGIKLISVHHDGIVLEFQGEIRTLRVGSEMF